MSNKHRKKRRNTVSPATAQETPKSSAGQDNPPDLPVPTLAQGIKPHTPINPIATRPRKGRMPNSTGGKSLVCTQCGGSYHIKVSGILVLAVISRHSRPCDQPGCTGTLQAPSKLGRAEQMMAVTLIRHGFLEYGSNETPDEGPAPPRPIQLAPPGQAEIEVFFTTGQPSADFRLSTSL